MWILVLVVAFYQGGAVATHEFANQASCEAALEKWKKLPGLNSTHGFCVARTVAQ